MRRHASGHEPTLGSAGLIRDREDAGATRREHELEAYRGIA
jgi:hypothetical protein